MDEAERSLPPLTTPRVQLSINLENGKAFIFRALFIARLLSLLCCLRRPMINNTQLPCRGSTAEIEVFDQGSDQNQTATPRQAPRIGDRAGQPGTPTSAHVERRRGIFPRRNGVN